MKQQDHLTKATLIVIVTPIKKKRQPRTSIYYKSILPQLKVSKNNFFPQPTEHELAVCGREVGHWSGGT